MINRIQNQSFCLHDIYIYMCTVYYARNNWRRAVKILEKIMHTRGGDAVTTRSGVNYSAYTIIATLQDIVQMIYFKVFVWFFYFIRYCEYDYFFPISSNASLANSQT